MIWRETFDNHLDLLATFVYFIVIPLCMETIFGSFSSFFSTSLLISKYAFKPSKELNYVYILALVLFGVLVCLSKVRLSDDSF